MSVTITNSSSMAVCSFTVSHLTVFSGAVNEKIAFDGVSMADLYGVTTAFIYFMHITELLLSVNHLVVTRGFFLLLERRGSVAHLY